MPVTNPILIDQTITSNGSALHHGDPGQEVSLLWNVTGPVTGVGPTLQFTLQEVDPADEVTANGSSATGSLITGTGVGTVTLSLVKSPTILVSWVVGGVTPSFGGTNATSVGKLVGNEVAVVGVPGGPAITVDQGDPNSNANAWPTKVSDGTDTVGISTVSGSKALKVDVIQSVGGSGGTNSSFGAPFPAAGTAAGFNDGTNMQGAKVFDADTGGGTEYVLGVELRKAASGGSVEAGTLADPLRTDPTGTTTQPVSGTVTADQGAAAAPGGAWPTEITDGTNVAAVKAASTPAVATDPALVVAISPNNPIVASNPSVGSNNAAAPSSSTQVGGTDGTNLQAAHVFDADTGGGTEYVLGVELRKAASGGSVEAGTASDPLRVDPTGTTTQPIQGVPGGVPVQVASGDLATEETQTFLRDYTLDRDQSLYEQFRTGQKPGDRSLPVVLASDQRPLVIGVQDPNNSTTTLLGAGGIWTGSQFTSCVGYDVIQVYLNSDTNSATSGVQVYWDYDGSGANAILDLEQAFTYGGLVWGVFPIRIRAPFFKISYTNDVFAQTVFQLVTALKTVTPDATLVPGQPINAAGGSDASRANLVAGADLSQIARVLRVDSDGTVRVDPTGTTTQPVSVTNDHVPVSFDPGTVDTFGHLVVASRSAHILVPFFQAAPSTLLTVTTSGTGSTSQLNGAGVFSTGATSGSEAKGVSLNTVSYAAHYELYAAFTAAFTIGTVGSVQRIGLYDSLNGFSFGDNGNVFGLWIKLNGADNFIGKTSWNVDTLIGAVGSKFTSGGAPVALNPVAMNLYRVRFGWLGIANIIFEVLAPDGNFVIVHVYKATNSLSSVHITNPNLPMTIDVTNPAVASNISVTCGCWVAGSTSPGHSVVNGTGTITAPNAAVVFQTIDQSSAAFTISGSWTGTLAFQFSVDGGVTWTNDLALDSLTGAFITSTTTNRTIEANVSAYNLYRIVATAFSAGTATINYNCGAGTNIVVANSKVSGGILDYFNNTSTLLLANAIYTGSFVSTVGYDVLYVRVFSDVASAAVGVAVLWSNDGVTADWSDSEQAFTYSGFSLPTTYQLRIRAPFYKVQYTNGGSDQASFSLSSILKIAPTDPTVLDGQLINGREVARPALVAASDGTNARTVRSGTDGNLSTNRTVTGGLTGPASQTIATDGLASVGIQVTGSWSSGSLVFEGSVDGTNYFAVFVVPLDTSTPSPVTSTTLNGQWTLGTAGLAKFRVRGTAALGGTASITLVGTPGAPVSEIATSSTSSSTTVISPVAQDSIAREVTLAKLASEETIAFIRDLLLDAYSWQRRQFGIGRQPNATSLPVTLASSSTPVLKNVAGSASSVTLLAANAARVGATIFNDSSANLYIKPGTTASTTSFTVLMLPNSYYEVPFGYIGRIDGIWASATGNARVTEFLD